MYRPQEAFETDRKGKRRLSRDYLAYLRDKISMTPEERIEWYLLGVPLSRSREARIVGLGDACDFILAPINHNGD